MGDRVAQDMTNAGGIPIEAFDLVQHDISIYDECIYAVSGAMTVMPFLRNITPLRSWL